MDEATREGATVQDRLESFLLAQEAPEKPATEEPTSQEMESEVVEDPETNDLDPEEVGVQDGADDSEEPQLSLDDLAGYLGVNADKFDVDDDGNLYVKTVVDGEEGRAKFSDLIKSHQLEGHLNKQNMEVAEQRKQLEAKMAEVEQQAQSRLQQLDDASKLAWNHLTAEYNAIDWVDLRQADPAEFAAKQTEFVQRQSQLQQAFGYLENQRMAAQKQAEAKEAEKLMAVIPEWKDQAVANKEKVELSAYLATKGISPEVARYADGIALLRKAMQFDKLQQTKAEVTKKVKSAPKLAKPGQSVSKQDRAQAETRNLKAAIRKSGGKVGIADYLLRTGKV